MNRKLVVVLACVICAVGVLIALVLSMGISVEIGLVPAATLAANEPTFQALRLLERAASWVIRIGLVIAVVGVGIVYFRERLRQRASRHKTPPN